MLTARNSVTDRLSKIEKPGPILLSKTESLTKRERKIFVCLDIREKSVFTERAKQKSGRSPTGVALRLNGSTRCKGFDSFANHVARSAYKSRISSTRGHKVIMGFADDVTSDVEKTYPNSHRGCSRGAEAGTEYVKRL